jgi:hypothetical protein
MIDIVIVGGGIAGLYVAYKIRKMYPTKKFVVLEGNDHLGGRAGNVNFHGESVPIGAGVGRKNKDKLLLAIVKELKIPFHEFIAASQYSSLIGNGCKVKEMFLYLKKSYDHEKDKMKTFKQYARPKLDEQYQKNAYEYFIVCAGYTDYENESAYDTLHHYGFDDNYTNWPGYAFSWNELVEKLAFHVGSKNIHKSCYVKEIKQLAEYGNSYEIICNKNASFLCKKVIMATTIDSVMKLLDNKFIYNQIKGQHFLRIYGKFSKESIPIMEEKCGTTTVVPGPIHKIIPMNTEKGIYMIAYTDNEGAKLLDQYKSNTVNNRNKLCRLLEEALDIAKHSLELEDMVDFYWEIGTHYYKPLRGDFKNRKDFCNHAQRPSENIRVVGEMVSMKQGWVEGALESVENVIREKWIIVE